MKYPLKDLTKITPLEWMRLAAFIDGEGCICSACSVHKDPKFQGARQRYEYIKVVVTGTDPRLTLWCAETFGGNIQNSSNNKRRNPRWKPAFFWSHSCSKAAAILQGVLPYLLLKREQAEIALALQATMSRCGVRGTPQAVIDHRAALMEKLHVLNARGPREDVAAS